MTDSQLGPFKMLLLAAILPWAACDRSAPPQSIPKNAESLQILHYDVDGDGELSEEEKKSMNEKFIARFDEDGDGKLGTKDRNAIRERAKLSVSVAPGGSRGNSEASINFIQRLDKNGDEALEADEVDERQWTAISRMDSNGDGKVTAEEWGARTGGVIGTSGAFAPGSGAL